MRILIIEDETVLCKSISDGLRMDGYETDLCFDGEQGLELCLTEAYDLILLDLSLPGMDGLDLLKQFRAADASTPVLILSARGQIQDKVEGLDLGANDYLTKPFHFEELEARIRSLTIAALVAGTCIVLNILISHSAFTGIGALEDYTILIDEALNSPVSLNITPSQWVPQLNEQIQKTKSLFILQSILSTALLILVSSFLTYFLAGRALAPLRELSLQMQKVQAQNLSVPLNVPETDDEIALLTRTFNEMLSRLDKSFTAQKHFAANAAHELRTPLAVIQTNLEVFQKKTSPEKEEYAEIFSMLREQTGRLSHLVETLLDMTSLQTVPKTDHVSLAELTEEVFCDLEKIASAKQVALIQEEGDAAVSGSYLLLYRAVYNLVENAVKYNRPGGTVTVNIRRENDTAVLLVSDTGIGISPENAEKIFAPFFRVDKSRSRAMGGSGLGLALVKAILSHHNGCIRILKSGPEGTTMRLCLPACPSEIHPSSEG